MARWTSRPTVTDLADTDTVLLADQSRDVGDRDVQVELQTLRTYLGAGITVGVTQAAHGLSVGDVVRHDGTEYAQATADTAGNSEAVGVVTTVPDSGSFTYQTAGVISTLSGLTPGSLYYLQDDGTLGTSAGTVEKPILIATSATTAVLILAISGEAVGIPAGGTTGQVLAKASNTNFDTEWVNQSGGGGSGDLTVVQHGSNASTARPSAPIVYWIGSVAPNNRQTGDLWLEV